MPNCVFTLFLLAKLGDTHGLGFILGRSAFLVGTGQPLCCSALFPLLLLLLLLLFLSTPASAALDGAVRRHDSEKRRASAARRRVEGVTTILPFGFVLLVAALCSLRSAQQ